MGEASFFLNYGYLSLGGGDEARSTCPTASSTRTRSGWPTSWSGRPTLGGRVLDVGCGRGGTAALLADRSGRRSLGVDLSPEAIAFCRERPTGTRSCRFEVGDAEHLPLDDDSCDVVTNLESSHTYPDMRAFLARCAACCGAVAGSCTPTCWPGSAGWRCGRSCSRLGSSVSDRPGHHRERARVLRRGGRQPDAGLRRPERAHRQLPRRPGIGRLRADEQSGAWEYRILRSRLS